MRINFEEARIYVRPGSTDLRKGVSGLCSIIVNEQDKQIIGRSIATPSLLAHVFMGKSPEDYLRCLFEKSPYAESEEDWEKLLPWNIEITPFQFRGEWMDLVKQG